MSWTIIVYAVVFFWLFGIVGRWLWSLNTLHAANQDRKAREMSLEMQKLQLEEQRRAFAAQAAALQQMQANQQSQEQYPPSNQASQR